MKKSKPCSKCGVTQPLENFSKNQKARDGVQSQCKSCNARYALENRQRISERNKSKRLVDGERMRAQSRASYAKHREKRLDYMKRRYSDRGDEYRAQGRERYLLHAEQRRAKSKAWREANPERYKQQMDSWRARNLNKHNENARKRRARLRSVSIGEVSAKDIRRILSQPCLYCGALEELTIEHIVPIARGGSHSIGNLASACKSCNSRKKDSFVTEWRKRESPRA